MSRPSIARVCVEVNLLHEPPKRIRLGTSENSYFQSITYENLPDYCLECRKIDHAAPDCRHVKGRKKDIEMRSKNPSAMEDQSTKAPVVGKENIPVSVEAVVRNKNSKGTADHSKGVPVVENNIWKQKEGSSSHVEGLEKVKEASTSEQRFSKDQLNLFLQKTKQKEVSLDAHEEEETEKSAEQNVSDLQIVVYKDLVKVTEELPKVVTQSHFHILSEIQENQDDEGEKETQNDLANPSFELEVEPDSVDELEKIKTLKKNSAISSDDSDVGRTLATSHSQEAHLITSDDEGKKKKIERPKGSTKAAKLPVAKTRASARLLSNSLPN
ncbi:OLC1v1036103C1 [Oldenlandia corymbosa var. corymbosa]|uniref:OLC1v1036103C1 n=1 Tax=Oldenlandia corymbosa var. corymbosa TaxID=529605 RepID=A0AAV1CVM8_OLDCO|nr:OLC1v1036103C1 [Oldenlandia corymbosa var. corymbosa]